MAIHKKQKKFQMRMSGADHRLLMLLADIDRISMAAWIQEQIRAEAKRRGGEMKDTAKMSEVEMRGEIKRLRSVLAFAKCPNEGCVEGVIPHRVSETEWEGQQCQWCDERKALTG